MKRLKYVATLIGFFMCLILAFPLTSCSALHLSKVSFVNDGQVLFLTVYEDGKSVEFPNLKPTKASDDKYNYVFAGWKLERDQIMVVPDEGGTHADVITDYVVDGSVTFYAMFYAEDKTKTYTYNVTFVDKDDEVLCEQMVNRNESATPPTPTSYEGWSFTNWETRVKGENYQNVLSDMTVHAEYEKNTYALRLHALDEVTETKVAFEENINLNAAGDIGSLIKFDGWFFDKNFSQPFDLLTMPANDVDVYAKYHFDLSNLLLEDVGEFEYGKNPIVRVAGIEDNLGITYNFEWQDGENVSVDPFITLKNAGAHNVSVLVSASYKTLTERVRFSAEYFVEKAVLSSKIMVDTVELRGGTEFEYGLAPTLNDFALKIEGLQYGETPESLGIVPVFSLSAGGDGSRLGVGSYVVSVEDIDLQNYEILSTESVEFSVIPKKATARVIVPKGPNYYGNKLTLQTALDGILDGDDFGEFKIVVNGNDYNHDMFDAGEYVAKVLGAENENYEIDCPETYFEILRRVASAQIITKNFVYGEFETFKQLLSEFSLQIDNVLEADKPGFAFELIIVGKDADAKAQAGTYECVLNFSPNDNYDFSAESAEFEISQARAQIVLASDKTDYVYGETPEISATFDGLKLSDHFDFDKSRIVIINGTEVFDGDKFTAGNYECYAVIDDLTLDNYIIENAERIHFNVAKKVLEVSVDAPSELVYGNEFMVGFDDVSLSNFEFEESKDTVDFNFEHFILLSGEPHSGRFVVGDYTCTIRVTSENYEASAEVGFKVVPAKLSIEWLGKTVFEFGENIDVSANVTGFLYDDEDDFDLSKIVFYCPICNKLNLINLNGNMVLGSGSYTAKVEALENLTGNYEIDDGANEFEIVVNKFDLSITDTGKYQSRAKTLASGFAVVPTFVGTAFDGILNFDGKILLNTAELGYYRLSGTQDLGENFVWENGQYVIYALVDGVKINFTGSVNLIFDIDITITATTFTTQFPEPAEVTYSGSEFNAGIVATFDEEVEGYEIVVKYCVGDPNGEYVESAPMLKNVGEYTIYYKIVFVGAETYEYVKDDLLYKFSIKKADYVVESNDQEFVFDATSHSISPITISNFVSDDEYKVVYGFNGESGLVALPELMNAGTYEFSYKISGSKNYNDAEGTFRVIINPWNLFDAEAEAESKGQTLIEFLDKSANFVKKSSSSVAEITGSLIFGLEFEYGMAHSAEINITAPTADYLLAYQIFKFVGGEFVLVEKQTNSAFDEIGLFKIVCTISGDNVEGSATYFVEVGKATLVVTTPGDQQFDYNFGNALAVLGVSLSIENNPLIVITYNISFTDYDGETRQFTSLDSIKDAGNYVVSFVVSSDHYEIDGAEGSFKVEVKKIQSQIVGTEEINTNYVFNGGTQVIDLSGVHVSVGSMDEAIQISFNREDVNFDGSRVQFVNVDDANGLVITFTVRESKNFKETQKSIQIFVSKAKYTGSEFVVPTFERQQMQLNKTLASIEFDNSFMRWKDSSQKLVFGTNGVNNYAAIYNADSKNYEDFEFNVQIETYRKVIKIESVQPFEENLGIQTLANDAGKFEIGVADGTLNSEEKSLALSALSCILDLSDIDFKVGGTYYVGYNFTISQNEYFELDKSMVTADSYLKLKSVYVGGTSYTIEDALALTSGTLVVKGDTQFATSKFNSKIALKNYGLTTYTIASGVKLQLPYDKESNINTTTRDNYTRSSIGNASFLKLSLVVSDGITIINNGTIEIGGITTGGNGGSSPAGQTTADYAQITLGANAKIDSYGTINCYGTIAEASTNNGSSVNILKGSLLMPFVVVEHRGGSVFYGMYENLIGSPFNRFYLENVSTKLIFTSAGSLLGHANLYASGGDNETNINLIGSSSAYLIQLGANCEVEAKFNKSTKVSDLKFFGSFTVNALTLNVAGQKVSTKNVHFPISWYFNITLNPFKDGSGAVVTANSTKGFKIMQGASVIVEKGVTLNVKELTVYDNTFKDAGISSTKYETNKADGKLVVNGTLNAESIGGYVTTTADGAAINISKNAFVVSYEVDSKAGSSLSTTVTYQTIRFELVCDIYNENGNSKGTVTENGNLKSKNKVWIVPSLSKFNIVYNFVYRDAQGSSVSGVGLPNINNPETYTLSSMFELKAASQKGYTFVGWFKSAGCTDEIVEVNGESLNGQTLTLYGLFVESSEDVYEITYSANNADATIYGGNTFIELIPASKLSSYSTSAHVPERENYNFGGWFKDASCAGDAVVNLQASEFANKAITLYAKWVIKQFTVTVSKGTGTNLTVSVNGVAQSATSFKVDVGAKVEVNASLASGYVSLAITTNPAGLFSGNTSGSFLMPATDVSISTSAEKEDSGCFVEGTLITLADGSQKRVEDLTADDILLVFNHETGRYETSKLAYNIHANAPRAWHNCVSLKFDDGTTLKIAECHGLFDLTLGKYVYISYSNALEFVGHVFAGAMGSEFGFASSGKTLVDAVVSYEFVKIYSPISAYHMNVVAENMLTTTSFLINGSEFGIQGFVNFFEYDENMKYDEAKMQADIEKYGLFTYEDFEDIMPRELFEVGLWKYLKVAIGKGQLTFDEILQTLNYIYYSGQC